MYCFLTLREFKLRLASMSQYQFHFHFSRLLDPRHLLREISISMVSLCLPSLISIVDLSINMGLVGKGKIDGMK